MRIIDKRRVVIATWGLLFAWHIVITASADAEDYSLKMPRATRSLLLDGIVVDGRVITVGERGHILGSSDAGKTWRQLDVPTRTMLTGVYFINSNLGWAVGHDAVILRTEDGGNSWQRVHHAPDDEIPLFDIWFKDTQNGFAIGAYGLFLRSSDGGKTWLQSQLEVVDEVHQDVVESTTFESEERLDDDEFTYDFHLNAVTNTTGHLYIAAEAGNIYRSDNAGNTWKQLPSPYEGSYFGVLPLKDKAVLVFGLRGNLYRSDDAGYVWQRIETSTQEMLTHGVILQDGTVVIVGLGGTILISKDEGLSFMLAQQVDRSGVSAVVQVNDNSLILMGEAGVKKLPVHSFVQ